MNKNDEVLKHFNFVIIDIICYIVSFLISNVIVFNNINLSQRPTNYSNILLWGIISIVLSNIVLNNYKDILKRPNYDELIYSLKEVVFSILIVNAILFILKIGSLFSRRTLFYTYIFFYIFSIAIRIVTKKYIVNKINTFNINNNRLLIVADSKCIDDIVYNIENSEVRLYTIYGICLIDKVTDKNNSNYHYCSTKEICDFVFNNNIKTVFISTNIKNVQKKVVAHLISNGISVCISINELLGQDFEKEAIQKIGIYNTLEVGSFSFSNEQLLYFVVKRILDIVFSIFGIIVLLPLTIIVKAIYVFNGDKYPIIYKHIRIGKDGKEFSLYKFRSMVPDADAKLKELLKDKKYRDEWNKNKKFDNDPRITKIGNFLRKTSLDEFPQFINVLKGDMSLIGPRPLVPGELFDKNGFKLYEKVKPGITGWWACNGRSEISYEDRLDLEYYYVKNISLKLDLICIIKTIYVVLTKKGAK